MGASRERERGAAAVEFAILVPVILVLVFGIVAYGYMFSFRQALSQAASEGARAAVGAPTTCTAMSSPYTGSTCAAQSAAASAVASSLASYSMSCGVSYLTCSITAPFSGADASGATCPSGHTCVRVALSYPYRDHSLLPTVPGFGFTLPSTLSFASVVQVS